MLVVTGTNNIMLVIAAIKNYGSLNGNKPYEWNLSKFITSPNGLPKFIEGRFDADNYKKKNEEPPSFDYNRPKSPEYLEELKRFKEGK